MSVQATMSRLKGRLNDLAEEKIEERLEDLADYATRISPVDTGAYVTSFSIKRAGAGGGRSRSSENKPRNQNPETKKQEAYGQLLTDIEALNISDMIENGNVRITLRNRSPHARDVEDGANWRSSGYHVFARIRRKFG
jgi:hypothetical protein